jgi:hypothetical protein
MCAIARQPGFWKNPSNFSRDCTSRLGSTVTGDDDLRIRLGRVRDQGRASRSKPFIAQALAAADKAGGRPGSSARSSTFGRGCRRASPPPGGWVTGRAARWSRRVNSDHEMTLRFAAASAQRSTLADGPGSTVPLRPRRRAMIASSISGPRPITPWTGTSGRPSSGACASLSASDWPSRLDLPDGICQNVPSRP